MNYLGIDYGLAHVGIAVASGPLAEPLTTIPTNEALQKISELIVKLKINEIVVGDCDATFLQQLRFINTYVHVVDETLSSHDARMALLHTTQKRRREKEHAVAAAVILQGWLDSNHQNS